MTFDDIYKECFSVIVKYCSRHVGASLASDVATDAFALLWCQWNELRSHERQVLLVWLYRTAGNLIKQERKKNRMQVISIDDRNVENLVEKRLQETVFEFNPNEEYKRYLQYIADIKPKLNAKEWQLFEYRVVKEYDYRKIAEEIKLSEEAVKMRWYRLRVKLRPIVDKLIAKNL